MADDSNKYNRAQVDPSRLAENALSGSDLSGGGGSGSGSGGGSVSDQQKKAAENLAPITLYGQNTIEDKANQMGDVYDIADQGNQNIAAFQAQQAEKAAGAEWFSRLLNEQSTYDQLRNTMGNGRYGSGTLDLNQRMQRVHDANGVDVLEALESNLADIDVDAMYALQSNINARNELAANTEAQLRSNLGDYAAQMNNISPDTAEDVIDVDNMELNFPDWANEEWFAEHKADAYKPEYISRLTRPDAATQRAIRTKREQGSFFDQWDQGLQSLGTNNSSAANKKYWDTLTRDYGHRVV